MQGSINFDGSLVGNITGGGGGGGSDVVITPVITSGTKIADVTVNGVEKDLYCPTPPTPQEISITPVQESGTKIADISLNGEEKDLYAPNPTAVSVSQVQQSGTKIATIGVNGVNTDIYAPNGGGDIYSTDEQIVGTWVDGRPIYKKTFIKNITLPSGSWVTTGDSIPNGQVIKSESSRLDSISDSILTWAETGEDGHIELINIRNTGTVTITHYTLWYLKTTDMHS